jgi:hypothetical protein
MCRNAENRDAGAVTESFYLATLPPSASRSGKFFELMTQTFFQTFILDAATQPRGPRSPLQPDTTQSQASPNADEAWRQAQELYLSKGEGCLEGTIAALLLMRDFDRETYSAEDDQGVHENAALINQRFGAHRAAQIILEAIAARDLNLNAARALVVPRDI